MEKMVARVGNKKGATMAGASWIQDVEDDLSTWEIINRSDDDDDDDGEEEEEENEAFFYDEDGDIFILEFLPSDLDTRSSPRDHADEDEVDVLDSEDSPIDERSGNDDDDNEEEDVDHGHVDYDDDDDDEDDGGYEYDLDDNLVPKSVSNRFGGQRMKKLWKRASPKMNNSKKLPYYYFNRPGFVHGKN